MFIVSSSEVSGDVPGLQSVATAILTPCLRKSSIGGRLVFRIDATRKQLFEPFVDALTPKTFLHERVEAEGRQVTFVEHHRVAERDGAGIIGVRTNEVEEFTRPLPVSAVPIYELLAIDRGCYCRHGCRLQDGRTPLDHALSDGEDFELAFAVAPEDGRQILAAQPVPGIELVKVGEFVESGFYLETAGRRRPLGPRGYVHRLD